MSLIRNAANICVTDSERCLQCVVSLAGVYLMRTSKDALPEPACAPLSTSPRNIAPRAWIASTCLLALLAAILGVITFVQWGELRKRGTGADWGSVPDWVAGVGTVLAFAIAMVVFAYEVWERRRSDRRRQAERITAWLHTGMSSQYREWIQGQGLDVLVHAQVNLINASVGHV